MEIETTETERCTFDSLSEDNLACILDFFGEKSYCVFGLINRKCNNLFQSSSTSSRKFPKKTFLQAFAPHATVIKNFEALYDPEGVVTIRGFWGTDETKIIQCPYEDFVYGLGGHAECFHSELDIFRSFAKGIIYFDRKDLLRWAMAQQIKPLLFAICYEACFTRRLQIIDMVFRVSDDEVVEYIREDNLGLLAEVPASKGDVQVLNWLYRNMKCSCINENDCIDAAIVKSQINVLRWLHSKHCDFDTQDWGVAVAHGQVESAKFLKGIGVEPDKGTFAEVTYTVREKFRTEDKNARQMKILEYLLEINCPWDEETFINAAKTHAPISVLNFLKKNGCPYSQECVYEAQTNEETLRWFRDNGYEWEYYDEFFDENDKFIVEETDDENHNDDGAYNSLSLSP